MMYKWDNFNFFNSSVTTMKTIEEVLYQPRAGFAALTYIISLIREDYLLFYRLSLARYVFLMHIKLNCPIDNDLILEVNFEGIEHLSVASHIRQN